MHILLHTQYTIFLVISKKREKGVNPNKCAHATQTKPHYTTYHDLDYFFLWFTKLCFVTYKTPIHSI